VSGARIRPAAGAPHARILGVGAYRPARIVTNAEVCERIDSSDEWIRERSGIVTRRYAAPDESVADMAVAAAGKALAHAGVAPEAVGCMILATITHPYQTPSASAEVAYRIGATNAGAFDLSAACAGFCYGVGLANDMVRGGSSEYVVVVGTEKLTQFTDLSDRSTAFIFGDGSGAVVVGPSDEPGIGPTTWGADGSQLRTIEIREKDVAGGETDAMGGPVMHMQGQSVFRWAVWQMAPVAHRALQLAGVRVEDLDAFIPHQANMRIIDAMVKVMKLPSHVAVARDIAETGNTSAASIPLAMERMLSTGEVKSGGTALTIGFGAGLVYAAQVVTLP
jgi:3-oxoacyl-[acyl-carrier-protein] synthase III